MVTRNQIQVINSLQTTKGRKAHGMFVAEGRKCIEDLLRSNLELVYLFETEALFDIKKLKNTGFTFAHISTADLKKMSSLVVPNNCLAVFKIPLPKTPINNGLILALDDIQDPGNLGTIIRLCDWFGVSQLVCSTNTVDIYNPKVVQATMGTIATISIIYTDLEKYLQNAILPIFGTFMNGDTIYKETKANDAIIIMGNEGNGISSHIEKLVNMRISIPHFNNNLQAESLNVATATAIVLNEFKRGN